MAKKNSKKITQEIEVASSLEESVDEGGLEELEDELLERSSQASKEISGNETESENESHDEISEEEEEEGKEELESEASLESLKDEEESEDDKELENGDGSQQEDSVTDEEESEKEEEEEEDRFVTNLSFKDLGLNDWLIEALKKMSITSPTEIQANCIPAILQGRDVVGGAKTGSGKTAAFALPMLHKLAIDPYGTFGLVITPTRELAFQLAEQFAAIGDSIHLRYTVLVGGLNMMHQALELSRRPHVIIATPGRLADLIRSSPDVIFLKRLAMLVLDEADRLLTPTFAEDLGEIFNVLPSSRQTLLFTATMTDYVLKLGQRRSDNKPAPFIYTVKSDTMTVATLKQSYLFLPGYVKETYLYHLLTLPEFQDKSAIIFVGKCYTAELVKVMLCNLGHKCVSLHSKMTQRDRMSALSRFKAATTTTLISTDVGSRGLDIPSVQLVVNYDIPRDPADYVHRVGRTARAGRGGQAISLVSERDVQLVQAIESNIGKELESFEINEDNVMELLNKVSEGKRMATMHLHDTEFGLREKLRAEKHAAKHQTTIVNKRHKARDPFEK